MTTSNYSFLQALREKKRIKIKEAGWVKEDGQNSIVYR